jgi:hypothetical protein
MATRPKLRHTGDCAESRVPKEFEDVAERVFRDDSPGEPLYGDILDEPAEDAA